MEDCFDLMEVAMDPVHGVVLTDVFPEIDQSLRHDLEPQLLQDLALDSISQGLAVILAAARQDEEFALFGADTDREDLVTAQDDGPSGRADARGCAA
jgi:hypothetical protein